jgi:hypothetical protein
MLTVLTPEAATSIEATTRDGRILVSPRDVSVVLGWEVKPEGLCRGDVCVPVGAEAGVRHGAQIDLVAAAALLGSTALIDEPGAIAAISVSAPDRRGALKDRKAADFTLPDLDGRRHSLEEFKDRKRLLVAFASW